MNLIGLYHVNKSNSYPQYLIEYNKNPRKLVNINWWTPYYKENIQVSNNFPTHQLWPKIDPDIKRVIVLKHEEINE